MFAKLAIVVNVLVYIVDINIVVYVVSVVCGVVCCVVPLYLQASVAESGNIRAVMPLLKVAVVKKRKRSLTPLAREDAPVLSADGATCLANLDGHFKEFDGLGMSVDVEA